MDPFIGEIKAVGWNFAARGYAMCNGQLLPISQNTALFSLLGTFYGGNGQSTFGLPNLQGRVPIHQGQSNASGTIYTIGEASGVERVTLTTTQMPIHTHTAVTTLNGSISGMTATTTINAITRPSARQATPTGAMLTAGTDANNVALNNFALPTAGTVAALAPEAASTTLTGGTVGGNGTTIIGNAGGSLPVSLMQPYLTVTYLIALTGIFPSRS